MQLRDKWEYENYNIDAHNTITDTHGSDEDGQVSDDDEDDILAEDNNYKIACAFGFAQSLLKDGAGSITTVVTEMMRTLQNEIWSAMHERAFDLGVDVGELTYPETVE